MRESRRDGLPGSRRVLGAVAIALTLCGIVCVQQLEIGSTNFGGSDEWLILELSARGVIGVPYQNRPLTYVWQQPPALLGGGTLTAFWVWSGLYLAGTSLLTALLVTRIAPGSPVLALLAGVIAAGWAPLDYLRLDTVLICGYLGATLATFLAIALFEESWGRRSVVLLSVAAGVGALATMTVESTLPVLAVAPLVTWHERGSARRQWLHWSLAWGVMLLLAGIRVVLPMALTASYQTHALGLDPAPLRVASRLVQLVALQAGPILNVSWQELGVGAAGAGALVFVVGWLISALLSRGTAASVPARAGVRLLAIGGLLCLAAHVTLALTELKVPARTQILSGPGFAIALAGLVGLSSCLLPRRLSGMAALTLGVWMTAVGTGRVVAMQGEWSSERSLFGAQRESLAGLTAAAPALRAGTLLVLIDERGAWPTAFTFRHAIAHLYGREVVGLAYGAADFLYPSYPTSGGMVVVPWATIRTEWGVAPSLHGWDEIVVARYGGDGRVEILPDWPAGILPALPAGARYEPGARVMPRAVRERERRILQVQPGS